MSSKISICGTAFVNFIMVIIAGERRCRRVQIYADVDLISCRAQPTYDGAVGGGTNKNLASLAPPLHKILNTPLVYRLVLLFTAHKLS